MTTKQDLTQAFAGRAKERFDAFVTDLQEDLAKPVRDVLDEEHQVAMRALAHRIKEKFDRLREDLRQELSAPIMESISKLADSISEDSKKRSELADSLIHMAGAHQATTREMRQELSVPIMESLAKLAESIGRDDQKRTEMIANLLESHQANASLRDDLRKELSVPMMESLSKLTEAIGEDARKRDWLSGVLVNLTEAHQKTDGLTKQMIDLQRQGNAAISDLAQAVSKLADRPIVVDMKGIAAELAKVKFEVPPPRKVRRVPHRNKDGEIDYVEEIEQ